MEQKDHISKAGHNESFWKKLYEENPAKYLDWAVVGIFYSAMHYIDACYYKKSKKHFKNHEMADSEISRDKDLAVVYADYRDLKQYRWYASYKSKSFTKEDIQKDLLPSFDKIKTVMLSLLAP